MATSTYSRRLNLTRDQLAQFLTDQQQIRQFEKLFQIVDQIQYAPEEIAAINAAIADLIASDVSINISIDALEQDVAEITADISDIEIDVAVLNAKTQQVADSQPRPVVDYLDFYKAAQSTVLLF